MADAEARRERLVEVFKEASTCTRCALSETRTKVVFGAGNADADLMFIGEGPGAEEDRQGLPFVGRAGQLLNQLLESVGLSRDDVWISNTVRCRPPGNRDPQPEEIASCDRYTFSQVELIEPRVICTLGNFATKLLTGNPTGITKVRGTPQAHVIGGRSVYLFPLLHPAAALRTPKMAELLREDFKKLPALLKEPLPDLIPPADMAPLDEPGGPSASPAPASQAPAPGREAEEAGVDDQAGVVDGEEAGVDANQIGLFGDAASG
jgi:uracil-DNA glycosylase family 4